MNTATLVATFTDYPTARQAARELENLGIPRDSIYIVSNQKTAGAGSADYQTGQSQSGFMSWWHGLFGSEQHADDRKTFEGALANGNAILRVTTDAASVDPAVEVLNQQGAIDIDRGVRVYSHGPTLGKRRPTGLSPHPPSPNIMSEGAGTPGSGTLAGPTTARFTEQDFTPEYRKNFEQLFGSQSGFDSMEPAYEYGYRSAGDIRYKGRSWEEVENDLRAAYERDNPDVSWDRAKPAIRYGWGKVTGEQ
jgi:hypothetical protein